MDNNSIIQAIQQLATQQATSIPVPQIPTLNYTAPNTSDLDAKYSEFLTRASNDPDIVNYYNQLLQKAQGDTSIAENYLEQDYQTGVRNTVANLGGTLKQLGLQSTQENQAQQDALNKRGIALTQGDNGKLNYGGGQAGNELAQARQNQDLRTEAANRSAEQGVKGLAQTLQKGITNAGQSLASDTLNMQHQKESDISSRAGTYYGLYQSAEQAKQLAATNAQNAALNKSSAQSSGNYYDRAKNTGSLNGTNFNDINKWASAGGNISTNAF